MKSFYQPALFPRQIRSLYYLKLETGKPMTWHARKAVDLYLAGFPEIRYDEREIELTGRRYDLRSESPSRRRTEP